MGKLRIGLIGTGHWARSVHGPSVLAHGDTELVGVWGRDQTRTRAVAEELQTNPHAELETLLAQAEALTFAVPPDVQAPIAARAAEHGPVTREADRAVGGGCCSTRTRGR